MLGFRPERAIWWQTKRPFWVEPFHRGYVYRDKIGINTIVKETEVPFLYKPELYEFRGPVKNLKTNPDLGFGGMKVIGNFPDTTNGQEQLVLGGSSYFRARVYEHPFGTSTRGLAINVGLNQDEEFPVFREYWIEEAKQFDRTLVILSLLDSPSVVGAYRLELRPDRQQSTIEVAAKLFFRETPDKVGIAPLTSMWMWGDGLEGPVGDHRPSVHDADGLAIIDGDDTRHWRALSRQSYPSVVRLDQPAGIKGFGLIQRDRSYENYFDQEANYHLRPSVWIHPYEDWGAGAVELLELPGPHEGIDNVAAWWVPAKTIEPGVPLELNYRVQFFNGDLPDWDVARATHTRIDRASHKGEPLQFEVDFVGPKLSELPADAAIDVDVQTVSCRVLETSIRRVRTGHWTLSLKIQPDEGIPSIGVQAKLRQDKTVLSETWSYLCAVEAPEVSLPPWRLKELELQQSPSKQELP